jgi:glycosyltransferase involved in cell wall biosynthesis
MRILQVHCGYRVPAGEDTVVHAEAALLRAQGHEVHQHLVQNPSNPLSAVANLVVSVHNRSAVRGVLDAVREFRPDVAHVHNTWFSLSAAVVPALDAAGVPVVMTLHNYRLGCISVDLFRESAVCTRCVGAGPWAGVINRCYRDSFRLSAVAALEVAHHAHHGTFDHVHRFVAPSAFMADRLVEMGIPSDRLMVKPHFVDDGAPRARPVEESSRLLFVGRLAPGKGVESLLRAWERMRTSGLELVIVGDGPLSSELRESAPRGVKFTGWTDRATVLEMMRDSRALVFPSEWYEPFGMVLLEAMAAGLPVVVNRVADAATIVDADPRLVGVAGDADRLAECLRELTDDELVRAEGARMRQRYERCYTPAANAPLIDRVYAEAIDTRASQ